MVSSQFKPHHFSWLEKHPERTAEWLAARLLDGFHVHHLDGNHANNEPENLVLVEGMDHYRMHGLKAKRCLTRADAKKGATARSKSLTPARRRIIARKAARTRWKRKRQAERRARAIARANRVQGTLPAIAPPSQE